jgi:hypothetical protein
MLQFHNATNEIVSEVKSSFDRILDYFRPDPLLFPVKSKRFSAVYSRQVIKNICKKVDPIICNLIENSI